MSRKSVIVATLLALLPLPYGSVFGQSAPSQPAPQSLGDIARQVRSQKSASQSANTKVFTNENLTSNPGAADLHLSATPGLKSSAGETTPASSTPATSAPSQSLEQFKVSLDKMDGVLNHLSSMNRATLMISALGNDNVNFPGRPQWEQRLLDARQANVTQGRQLTQYARQLIGEAQTLDDAHVPTSDPSAAALQDKLKQFVQDYAHAGEAFRAAVQEGRTLARKTAGH